MTRSRHGNSFSFARKDTQKSGKQKYSPNPLTTLAVVFCWAYILGLLASSLSWLGAVILLGMGCIAALLRLPSLRSSLPIAWWMGPTAKQWLIAGVIGCLACFYIQIRTPYPAANDISRVIPLEQSSSVSSMTASTTARVQGTIESMPRLTRRGTVQLWLKPDQVWVENQSRSVDGKLYVTLSRKAAQNLYPGHKVRLTGRLYRPQPATLPRGFDFAAMLRREGAFAGLKAEEIKILRKGSGWGSWLIQQRIVRSLQSSLGKPNGALVSALVLGKEAVDIPYFLRDGFVQVGLAHALAASGTQVSILLSVVLKICDRFRNKIQMAVGGITLLGFGSLSGFEPSITRAIVMGLAALVALVFQRKTRPVMLLLATVTGLLLIHPLWVWDLGFQLSALATLGLMVSVPPLMERLDWLPPTIATWVAVPLAAMLWTLPLQLYVFGLFPIYSLVVNVLSAPLLTVLTLGSFVSAAIAALIPPLGSLVAWLLYWPIQGWVAMVLWIGTLPGNALVFGSLSVLQLVALYGLLVAVWLWPWLRQRWTLAASLAIVLVLFPIWQRQIQPFAITVMEADRAPMMVIQQPRGTLVLNGSDRNSLIPFLQQQGIGRIDLAIVTDGKVKTQENWQAIAKRFPIRQLDYTTPVSVAPQSTLKTSMLNAQETASLDKVQVQVYRSHPPTLMMQIANQRWLLVQDSDETDFETWLRTVNLGTVDVLWWQGRQQPPEAILVPRGFANAQLQPKVLILGVGQVTDAELNKLAQRVPQVFWLKRDGALQWTVKEGFKVTVNPGENRLSPLL
jgi:competence protein ComEC